MLAADPQIAGTTDRIGRWRGCIIGITVHIAINDSSRLSSSCKRQIEPGGLQIAKFEPRGWSEAQCQAYAIADNRLTRSSHWSEELLAAFRAVDKYLRAPFNRVKNPLVGCRSALLQRDVGHLAGRSVDLVERAIGERVNVDGIGIAAAHRLDARGGVRQIDPLALIAGLLKEARSTHAILRERVVSGCDRAFKTGKKRS